MVAFPPHPLSARPACLNLQQCLTRRLTAHLGRVTDLNSIVKMLMVRIKGTKEEEERGYRKEEEEEEEEEASLNQNRTVAIILPLTVVDGKSATKKTIGQKPSRRVLRSQNRRFMSW